MNVCLKRNLSDCDFDCAHFEYGLANNELSLDMNFKVLGQLERAKFTVV